MLLYGIRAGFVNTKLLKNVKLSVEPKALRAQGREKMRRIRHAPPCKGTAARKNMR